MTSGYQDTNDAQQNEDPHSLPIGSKNIDSIDASPQTKKCPKRTTTTTTTTTTNNNNNHNNQQQQQPPQQQHQHQQPQQ